MAYAGLSSSGDGLLVTSARAGNERPSSASKPSFISAHFRFLSTQRSFFSARSVLTCGNKHDDVNACVQGRENRNRQVGCFCDTELRGINSIRNFLGTLRSRSLQMAADCDKSPTIDPIGVTRRL